MTEKQYPELPTHFMLVQESFRDEVYLYTADQMRAYVDADRAMRAAQAAPAAWRHSRTYSVYEAAEQVPIADGDEWAEPLYLHPPEAPASQDAEDAAHIKNLCELVRMPNAEYVADAHNAAVKYLRARAAKEGGEA